jgi:nucleotide-binding universal stress UspA family protein
MSIRVGSMRHHHYPRTEAAYATLLMSTGLTFGSISALFGLTAFEDTLDLAALARARLSVVSVARPPEPPTEVETQAAIALATRHYEELFDGLQRQAQERIVTLETYVHVGHPADQILKAAARYGADMIVVGHRGRSAIRDWVSGSASRRIFTHATCPVLVVRSR